VASGLPRRLFSGAALYLPARHRGLYSRCRKRGRPHFGAGGRVLITNRPPNMSCSACGPRAA
jgi:hypothetical protein